MRSIGKQSYSCAESLDLPLQMDVSTTARARDNYSARLVRPMSFPFSGNILISESYGHVQQLILRLQNA